MEANGQDLRPEPLEARRKRLAKLHLGATRQCATASSLARRSPEDGAAIFRHVLDGPRRDRLEAHRVAIRERTYKGMAEDKNPKFER
jgi:uncharacterized protein (DUF1330 family)